MSDATAPRPGWYADPENPAAERWWNGSGWSEQQRPATQAPVPPASPPAPASASLIPPPVFPAAVDPAAAAPEVPVTAAPDSTGFTFGAPAGARPDPYAPPPPSPAQAPYTAYTAYSPYGAQPASSVNGIALAGLLVSCLGWMIVSVVGPVVGIILSIIGLSQATKREQQGLPNPGRGLAIAGIVVGGGLLLLILLFVVTFLGIGLTTR